MSLSDTAYGQLAANPLGSFLKLGTFWQNQLADEDVVQLLEWGRLCGFAQAREELNGLEAAWYLNQVQLGLTLIWYPVVLLQSELTQGANVIPYGSGHQYGDGLVYGQARQHGYQWAIDPDVLGLQCIVDQMISPTAVWGPGNLTVTQGRLLFGSNPFDRLSGSAKPVYDQTGKVIDHKLTLWARGVVVDQRDTALRFGIPIGLDGASTPAYQRVVSRIQNMLVQGPSAGALWAGIQEAAGLVPVQPGETVQSIDHLSGAVIVTTDQRVYRAAPTATALVQVGQVLTSMTQMFDTVGMQELNSGPIQPPGLDVWMIDHAVLGTGTGPLVFRNTTAAWTFRSAVNGPAARFPIGGALADVEAYWNAIVPGGFTREIAVGRLVAGQTVVNPLAFVLQQTGGPIIVVTIRPGDFISGEPRFYARVPDLVPAGTLVLFSTVLPGISDSNDFGTTSADQPSLYPALVPTIDIATVSPSGTQLGLVDLTPVLTVL